MLKYRQYASSSISIFHSLLVEQELLPSSLDVADFNLFQICLLRRHSIHLDWVAHTLLKFKCQLKLN
jgi:hypothetical protein